MFNLTTKNRKKNNLFNLFYFFIWIGPLYVFTKDFFIGEEFINFFTSGDFDFFTLKNSFEQGILTVIFSFIIGIIPAYYMAYNKNVLTRLLDKLFFIPFMFPPISAIVSFSIIFNIPFLKNSGLNYSLTSIIIANCFYNSPIFLKYIAEALKSIPKEVEEEAQIAGAKDYVVFFKIKLSLILPQIYRGAFLVFLYSFTSFILVLALGGAKYTTMEAEIATTLIGSFNFTKVMILGGIQSFILVFINTLSLKLYEYELNGTQYIKKTTKIFKYISVLYFVVLTLIILVSFTFSFFNFYIGEFSLEHYKTIFSSKFNETYPVIKGILNSTFLSVIGGLIVTTFSYCMIKSYNKLTNFIVYSTFGISSGFLGITLIYLNISFNIPLPIILIQGYVLVSLPLGYSFMCSYIKNFNNEILEAAQLDGVNYFTNFIYIEFPLLKRVFLWVFMQIFAILFGEFTIGYTMQISRVFPTLPLVNYSLISEKKFLESSALNTVTLIFLIMIFYISQKILEKD
ncbi:MAG: ABC transporter permease [Fusobacteriaceae bacterium]